MEPSSFTSNCLNDFSNSAFEVGFSLLKIIQKSSKFSLAVWGVQYLLIVFWDGLLPACWRAAQCKKGSYITITFGIGISAFFFNPYILASKFNICHYITIATDYRVTPMYVSQDSYILVYFIIENKKYIRLPAKET